MTKLEALLEAGVHFGHQVGRWNSKMAPYIHETKNGVHILDLVQTLNDLEKARVVLNRSKNVLFVGTRTQIAPIIEATAQKCNGHYVNTRWVGGLLTNWKTISNSIKRLDDLEIILDDNNSNNSLSKKELLDLSREKEKLLSNIGGIRNL